MHDLFYSYSISDTSPQMMLSVVTNVGPTCVNEFALGILSKFDHAMAVVTISLPVAFALQIS